MGMNVVSLTRNRFTLLLLTTVYSVSCLVGTVGSVNRTVSSKIVRV